MNPNKNMLMPNKDIPTSPTNISANASNTRKQRRSEKLDREVLRGLCL